jgi:flagellar biosynthetic protein FliR
MATELSLNTGTLLGFLLVLIRVAGVFVFVPLPGIKAGPEMARVVLSFAITLSLYHLWPVIRPENINTLKLIGLIASEGALGITIGVATSFLSEMFRMGAQILTLQAGYSFASTIDPTSGADSSVLLSIAETSAGLLFFGIGLDRQIIQAFALSLTTRPPGHFTLNLSVAHMVIQTGSLIFSTGLRLVLPIVALLLIVEIALALLARLNTQLHLMSLAFPIKMLLTLALFSWLVLIFPQLYTQASRPVMQLIRTLLLS